MKPGGVVVTGRLALMLLACTLIARGGGEHLESFASALSGTRGGVEAVITEHALRHAPVLLGASGPHDFIHRFNDLLASRPELRAYRI